MTHKCDYPWCYNECEDKYKHKGWIQFSNTTDIQKTTCTYPKSKAIHTIEKDKKELNFCSLKCLIRFIENLGYDGI